MAITPSRLSRLLGKTYIHLALIAVVGLLAYSNTFDVPFQWDEVPFITNNPIVKDLPYFLEPSTAKGLEQYGSLKNRYVGYLTFALNYRIHGFDVTGYHVVNIAIHIINALLVYFLVLFTFRTPFFRNRAEITAPLSLRGDEGGLPSPLADGGIKGEVIARSEGSQTLATKQSNYIALFTALLFVSHPIQTEAVTYIFQRLASLAAMFYLASIVFYVKWRLSPPPYSPLAKGMNEGVGEGIKGRVKIVGRVIFYLLSLLSAVLAMKTKENAFTLPVVIMLYEFFFFKDSLKKRMLWLTPLLLTMLIVPVTLIGSGQPAGAIIGSIASATKGHAEITRTAYLFTQFRVIVTYIRLLFIPVDQNVDYDYRISRSFLEPGVLISFLLLTSIVLFAFFLLYKARRSAPELRIIALGLLWFFLALSVESSLIPIPMLINEYRVYLPSVGAFTALVCGGAGLLAILKSAKITKATVLLTVFVIGALSSATYARNVIWGSKISLWEDAIKKSPNKARGFYNLGAAYSERGLINEAIRHYSAALRLNPDFIEAHQNLGTAYWHKGHPSKAIEHYRKALLLNDGNAELHYNIGTAYYSMGMPHKAMEHYQAALRLHPDYAEAHFNLGIAYNDSGLLDRAIEHYRATLKARPDYVEAHNNLALAYHARGLTDEAIKHLRIAGGLRPDNAVIHLNLGRIYLEKGYPDKARKEFETVLIIDPASEKAKAYLNRVRE